MNLALHVLVLPCPAKDKVARRDHHLHGAMRGKFRLVMQDLAFLLQDLQVNHELTSPTVHDETAVVLARRDHARGINPLRIKTTADGNSQFAPLQNKPEGNIIENAGYGASIVNEGNFELLAGEPDAFSQPARPLRKRTRPTFHRSPFVDGNRSRDSQRTSNPQ